MIQEIIDTNAAKHTWIFGCNISNVLIFWYICYVEFNNIFNSGICKFIMCRISHLANWGVGFFIRSFNILYLRKIHDSTVYNCRREDYWDVVVRRIDCRSNIIHDCITVSYASFAKQFSLRIVIDKAWICILLSFWSCTSHYWRIYRLKANSILSPDPVRINCACWEIRCSTGVIIWEN
jgi:hypothetical protein